MNPVKHSFYFSLQEVVMNPINYINMIVNELSMANLYPAIKLYIYNRYFDSIFRASRGYRTM